jgi:hypothetical protein
LFAAGGDLFEEFGVVGLNLFDVWVRCHSVAPIPRGFGFQGWPEDFYQMAQNFEDASQDEVRTS